MAIGERIAHFRKLRGMTQEALGTAVGLPQGIACSVIARYEKELLLPDDEMLHKLADALDVSFRALTPGGIDNYLDIAQTLFALEDLLELTPTLIDGVPHLRSSDKRLSHIFYLWAGKRAELERGEITRAEYDDWRCRFPRGGRK